MRQKRGQRERFVQWVFDPAGSLRTWGRDTPWNVRYISEQQRGVSVKQLEYIEQDYIEQDDTEREYTEGEYAEIEYTEDEYPGGESSVGEPMARILILDHDPAMTSALAARLEGVGYDVDVCHCSHAATQIALRQQPDLIILDVDMPVFTGLEFHECLQYAGRCRDIPVIYLSANDSPTSRLVALRQGARAFLTKPYDPRRLLDIIERIIGTGPSVPGRSACRSDHPRVRKTLDRSLFTPMAMLA